MTDSGYAALDLLAAVRHRVCVVARLRTEARLFDPAPPRTLPIPGAPNDPNKLPPQGALPDPYANPR